ncbi:protein EVI2A [Pelodiscus sinensis]|uniref:Ecotropic viral integration site 2A n=1 Tax=Pelodiscus sinensis TaxID=13735 RepID=K7EXI0_PELSI|nr:protein EVI2A [Pelodiscus sinensis]|eukprot:XP_006138655.1 protein EVI2A [Pelodiscus sinensis]
MKLAMHCNPYFAFIAVTIFALSLQIRANHTDSLWSEQYLDLNTQNISEKQSTTEDSSNLIPKTTDQNDELMTTQMQTDTFPSSTLGQEPSTSSLGFNLTSAVQDLLTTTKTLTATKIQITTTTEICGEKNKSLILICFIIIAVLFLACTFLLLSTVVMANKVSYLKRSKQGRRIPRNNGDFLATNSLWPAGSDTWQRKSKELIGVDLMMQDLMSETAITIQRNNATGTTETLTSGRVTNQKNEDATSKPCDNIITNFVVEI